MSENKLKYSDAKLKEFSKLIEEKIIETEKALAVANGFQKDQKEATVSSNVDFNENSKHFQQQATNKRMINRFSKKSKSEKFYFPIAFSKARNLT